MQKLLKLGVLAIGVITFILWILLLGSTDPYSDVMFYISYILLLVIVLAGVAYLFKNLFSSPGKLKSAIFVIVGFIVIIGVSYALSGSEAMKGATETQTKWVSTGLIVFYILTAVAIGSVLFSGVKKMISK